jgi:energy-coupling factor transporter ATP-binding protein EcfA2
MRPLDTLRIDAFRGIHDLSLEELGQINLFVGRNNCGKTTVLEAICALCHPLDVWEYIQIGYRRCGPNPSLSQLGSLQWLFPQTSRSQDSSVFRGELKISATGNHPVAEVWGSFARISANRERSRSSRDAASSDSFSYASVEERGRYRVQRSPDLSSSPDSSIRKGADIQLSVAFRDGAPIIAGTARARAERIQLYEDERLIKTVAALTTGVPCVIHNPHAQEREDLQQILYSSAVSRGFANDIMEMMRLILPGLEDIQLLSPESEPSGVYLKEEGRSFAPISTYGDGVRRLLGMASAMTFAKDGVLLLDEIETAIHTELLAPSFRWLCEASCRMGVQVFATTHSLEAVDALLLADESHSSLVTYRLNRDEGQCDAVRLDPQMLTTLRSELGQEVRW